ncbi:hypothetical protein FOE78_19430 [Microlunatus elymi]|uniref:Nucleotidyltransferase domain-containing protein n=1 Tax=Microlunatus elymi TaxID=2596828 RepID=A0A516Q330_9ACTN|nr:hypothetical protein [Microlunatus elymi]QDP97792.1 hypothetical protein FOE78_19430 [Microlunatus elymi]
MDKRHVARRLADRYVAMGNVSAVVLGGSLGRGRGDEVSDVELDIDWQRQPSDAQRKAPASALKGDVTSLWPYDADDGEWSEDVRVLGVDVTVSGFAADEVDRWIASLAAPRDLYLVRQMRMSAIQEGEVFSTAKRGSQTGAAPEPTRAVWRWSPLPVS